MLESVRGVREREREAGGGGRGDDDHALCDGRRLGEIKTRYSRKVAPKPEQRQTGQIIQELDPLSGANRA